MNVSSGGIRIEYTGKFIGNMEWLCPCVSIESYVRYRRSYGQVYLPEPVPSRRTRRGLGRMYSADPRVSMLQTAGLLTEVSKASML